MHNLILLLNFLIYFISSVTSTVIFLVIYDWVTPYHEINQIIKGNIAAVVSLGGAFIGFVIPLASVVQHATSILDLYIWSSVALVVQLFVHIVMRYLIPSLQDDINQQKLAPALWHAFLAIGVGMLNAACMTY